MSPTIERMQLASDFAEREKALPDWLDPDDLHRALVDSRLALREPAAKALFYVVCPTHLPYLVLAKRVEKDPRIRGIIELGILRRLPPHFPGKSDRTVLLASDYLPLAQALLGWCERNQKMLRFAEPESTEIIAVGCLALVVDRKYAGKQDWETYCALCEECAMPFPEDERVEIEQSFGADALDCTEDTPVIIIDEPSEKSRQEWPLVPPKEEGCLFWIERSRTDEILSALDRILAGQ